MCVTGHPAHCRDQVPITIQGEDPNFALAEGEDEDERLEKDGQGRKRVVKASYFGHSSFSGVAVVKESSVVSVKDLVKDDEDLKRFAPLGCGRMFDLFCNLVTMIYANLTWPDLKYRLVLWQS